MIKAIKNLIKNFHDKEIDYEIEFSFSIYDLIAGSVILFMLFWFIFK